MPTDRSDVVILATLFFSCQAQIPLFRHPPCLLFFPENTKPTCQSLWRWVRN